MRKVKYLLVLGLLLIFSLTSLADNDKLNKTDKIKSDPKERVNKTCHKTLDFLPGSVQMEYYRDELDESGGPDEFGYSFIDSDEDEGPVYNWIDISETGTVIDDFEDDDFHGPVELPFTFNFYGNDFTEIYFSSNGYLKFGDDGDYTDYSNDPIPTDLNPNNIICPFWDDFDPTTSGTLYYGEDEEGNFVITYENFAPFNGDGTTTFQVVLFPDYSILFQYSDIETYDLTGETVGIENEDGSIGLQVSYNGDPLDYPYDGLAISCSLPPNVGSLSGTVTDAETEEPVQGAMVYIYNTEGLQIGVESTDPAGYYTFNILTPGFYDITIRALNYQADYTEDFEVINDENIHDVFLSPAEEYSIDQLQTVIETGTWITTSGIVTQPSNSTTTGWTSFYIQDESGYGIHIYSPEPRPVEQNIDRGMEITVTGLLSETDGITEIAEFVLVINNVGNDLPAPYTLPTGEMAEAHQMEGTWALISGYLENDPGVGNYNIGIDDGSGPVTVRIWEETGIDLSDYSTGDPINVLGVLSLDQDNVRIVPSLQADIYLVVPYPPTDLTADLNDTTAQVTLNWLYDFNPPELDEFLEFSVVRDDVELGRTTDLTYVDQLPDSSATYVYMVRAVFHEGNSDFSDSAEVIYDYNFVLEELNGIPSTWTIERAYPNPFNPTVNIVLAIPQVVHVEATISNVLGQQVAILLDDQMEAGYHTLSWSAQNFPSGLYFLRVNSADGFTDVRRLIFVK